MKHTSLKGFTLIELLIVIAIIGILAGILFVSIGQEPLKKARDAKTMSDVNQIIQALELARVNSSDGKYPLSLSSGTNWSCLKPSASGTCWRGNYSGNDTLVSALSPTYFATIPKPPAGGAGCYMYDAYLYVSNHGAWNGNSANGTYIIYAKEHPLTTDECSGTSYNAGSYDCGLYYCYKFIGYNT